MRLTWSSIPKSASRGSPRSTTASHHWAATSWGTSWTTSAITLQLSTTLNKKQKRGLPSSETSWTSSAPEPSRTSSATRATSAAKAATTTTPRGTPGFWWSSITPSRRCFWRGSFCLSVSHLKLNNSKKLLQSSKESLWKIPAWLVDAGF